MRSALAAHKEPCVAPAQCAALGRCHDGLVLHDTYLCSALHLVLPLLALWQLPLQSHLKQGTGQLRVR